VTGRVALRFKLVDQLIELVEVNTWAEAERVRDGARRRMPARLRLLAETGAQRPVHHVLEWQSELAGPPLQQASQVVIDGESGAHCKASSLLKLLMSRHQMVR